MTSQTSLKELSKAISAFIVEPTVPLPDDLIEIIAGYLRRHSKYEEAAADRLQEELMSIFDKHVRGNLSASSAWIGILRRLLPMIQTNERILTWLDALKGVLSTRPNHDKGIVEETIAALMDLVTLADEYQDISENDQTLNPIMHQIFYIWISRFYPGYVGGVAGMEHNERIFRQALVQFGKRRPQQLFASLDSFFVQKDYRKAALRFLCDFIQNRPPHLHQVLQGTMFKNLLTCLLEDTSTAVISSALTALIMLLPHMPSSLVPHLPVLFNIYARVLFWNHNKSADGDSPAQVTESKTGWDIYLYEPGSEDASIAHLANYYTILYGLYPINFMDYIRKPQRYLRHAHVDNADDIEVQPTEIRDQSERFRRCHLLHPNFYSLTIESEKTDFGRFIKSEAAEVVAECMELYIAPDAFNNMLQDTSSFALQSAHSNDDSQRLSSEAGLLSKSLSHDIHLYLASPGSGRTNSTSTVMRRGSHSSAASNRDLSQVRSLDSGADGPRLIQSASQTHLQDIIHANKSIKSSLHAADADGLSSRPASVTDHSFIPRAPTPGLDSGASQQLAHLQRQNLLLQNDLSFERYQKQQHIAHIAELRKRQVVEASTEAETQNLIINNRILKNRYEDAKKAEIQVRKESDKIRALAKNWESGLSVRLKNARERAETAEAELGTLRRELEDSRREQEKLVKLVCDGEVRELSVRQNMQSVELHGAEVDHLKSEVERLSASERDHQAQEQERMAAIMSASAAESRLEEVTMKVEAQASELRQAKQLFQSQYSALQAKVADAGGQNGSVNADAKNTELRIALSASQMKQLDMQRQHDLLMRKYTALQRSLLEMDSDSDSDQTRPPVPHSQTAVEDYAPGAANALKLKTRTSVMPNAEGSGATSPLTSVAPDGKLGPRPSTPSGLETGTLPNSPDQRYHGRGGVQNRVRKDAPTAATTSSGKKEKKSTGLKAFVRGKTE